MVIITCLYTTITVLSFAKNSLRLLHGVTVMYRANGTSRHFCIIQIFGVPCLSELAGCPLGSC